MIDLHTHSSASDGSFSPEELLDMAGQRGLSGIALTDHDTITGLAAGAAAAERLGIGFIPGIEIEITWEPGEFHLLGLGIRRVSPAFTAALAELGGLREERNRAIIQKMRQVAMDVSYEDLLADARGPCIGRPHFAALMVRKKIVKNREQAFDKYLGKGRPLYVPKQGLEFRRGVDIIKDSGGIAVLAHPLSLYIAWGRLPALVKDLKDQGLDGLEAWHPTAKAHSCRRLEALGKSLGLYITAGSDYHGESRQDRKLGITAGNRKIEDSFLAGLPDLFVQPGAEGAFAGKK
ncbi:MAG: PHP domain-containing protein [Spirochaetaceae bacterium]|jgi:predicted metal-dependent phosphoesterase TrpH|nr:PHP domain-containing protein [Spirochaetaceae bacterium]